METCETCKFAKTEKDPTGGEFSVCFRYPPTPHFAVMPVASPLDPQPKIQQVFMSLRPRVTNPDGSIMERCGEYKKGENL